MDMKVDNDEEAADVLSDTGWDEVEAAEDGKSLRIGSMIGDC